jgi:hypothetical protein
LAPSQVGLHGPYVDKVIFTVISSDATLYNSLASGTIQGAEWTFQTGTYATATKDPNLYSNTTIGYTFDGIAFNELRAVTNTTAFRRAMAYLTDYGFLESTVLSGVAGSAQPDLFPCLAYPSACNPSIKTYPYSLTNAVKELKLAGLTEGNTTVVPLSSITWLYKGSAFQPKFYYRIDDPLRTGVATQLITAAKSIGLIFNAIGTSHAGGVIYGPAAAAVISAGVYNPATGGNIPPVYNYSMAKTSDTWDMYTFGWITNPNYNWAWEFFNDQNPADDFIDYANATMDHDTNTMEYASTITAAQTGAQKVDVDASYDLPYLMSFYQNTLYSVYINGWTGYANLPTTGPMTVTGAYYTLLNVHPSGQTSGGVFNYALHAVADAGGMDPLYNTNWVWQADIWSEVYDTPLATPPTKVNVALAVMPWMVSSYSVAAFTGSTGTGAGWFQMQGAQVAHNIKNGAAITMVFDKNITWTDHVPLTAYDYNFSVYAFGVSAPPSIPDIYTPLTGELTGALGLWATYIPPNNPNQITLYLNSTSVWNIPLAAEVYMMPQHIFKYFNIDKISTASGALDTTLPFAKATASAECGSPCSYLPSGGSVPTWVKYLPNLEVGSGPFWLRAYDSTTGAGELDKNVNYFRSAWAETAPSVLVGTTYTLSPNIQEYIYNAGSSAIGGVNPGITGYVAINNATGTVTAISPTGAVVHTYTLPSGQNGFYKVSIDTTGWAPGTYELVTNATYNFFGLQRTWYQADGLTVTSPTTVTSTTTSTSTSVSTTTSTSTSVSTTLSTSVSTTTSTSVSTSVTTSTSSAPNYTYYYLGAIVVLIIIVIVVAAMRRRPAT